PDRHRPGQAHYRGQHRGCHRAQHGQVGPGAHPRRGPAGRADHGGGRQGGPGRPGGRRRAAHGHGPRGAAGRRARRLRVDRAARADPAGLAGRGVHGADVRQRGVRRARPGSGENRGREGPVTTTSPVTPTRGPADPAAGRHAGFAGLLRAEWTKIRSVRSTVWTLVIFVVVCIGFTALIAWLTESNWFGPRAAARNLRVLADPVGFILGTGIGLGQLAIAVLGVLIITSEYSTGVIRASLLAVPRRLPVLAAKAVVFAVLLLVVTEIVAFCSFFVGSAILHAHVPVVLGDPGVTRAVIGAGLYLTVLGLLALAIGTMITHTAQTADDLLSPWQGFGVLCIWTVLALAVAGYLLEHRDA